MAYLVRGMRVLLLGEKSAKDASCQEKVKGEPHDDMMVTSDAPTQLLAPRPNVDEAGSGPSPRNSLDTGKYSSHPHNRYDIV